MVFYEYTLDYEIDKSKMEELVQEEAPESQPFTRRRRMPVNAKKRELYSLAQATNEELGFECGMDENASVFISDIEEKQLKLVAALKLEEVKLQDCETYICKAVRGALPNCLSCSIVSRKEIPAGELKRIFKRTERDGIFDAGGWFSRSLKVDYFNHYSFAARDQCFSEELTYEQILEKASGMMADKTIIKEIERIFSKKNEKAYYGNPVHYALRVGSVEAAKEIVSILVPALKANCRLLGSRVTFVNRITDSCFDEDEVKHLMEVSQGNTVVIDMSGTIEDDENYASAFQRVVEYFDLLIGKYGMNTLFIFVEDRSHPGFSKYLLAKVSETLDIVELKEGTGNKKQAISYFKSLSNGTDFEITEEEILELLPLKKVFSASEVQLAYKKWYGNGLKNKVYQAYKDVNVISIDKETPDSEPYLELQKMVGLSDIKQVVDQIIATANMSAMRRKMGLPTQKNALHMIFTGNPGSAKTTVARLIAQILQKEGILDTGAFVEVGRSDLVARYVGWTAKTVREKFRLAKGGVLFIDEAYSLVDDSKSFGDEAINTIVQEMENHREDVVVIFAGYPDKMKSFLDRNEGLRSRIAFHLDFPDYNADEMLEILELMVEKQGYVIDDGVRDKCRTIFENACAHEEFGNGRYVRNLLEQATMRQSERIWAKYNGKRASKKILSTLIATDFETSAGQQYKEKKAIGF